MKYDYFFLSVYWIERSKNIIFFKVDNTDDTYPWRMNTLTFGPDSVKNNGVVDYFIALIYPCLLSGNQFTAFGPSETEPHSFFLNTDSFTPVMSPCKENLPACKKNKLKQEAYEQLCSIKSYNNHYEEPEVVKYCRCPQQGVHVYTRGNLTAPDTNRFTDNNPSGNSYDIVINYMNVINHYVVLLMKKLISIQLDH